MIMKSQKRFDFLFVISGIGVRDLGYMMKHVFILSEGLKAKGKKPALLVLKTANIRFLLDTKKYKGRNVDILKALFINILQTTRFSLKHVLPRLRKLLMGKSIPVFPDIPIFF